MRKIESDRRVWRKSTFSEPNGNNCVEVAHAVEAVGVRDSKNTDGAKLMFDRSGWLGFVTTVSR